MSAMNIGWIWKQDISPTQKLVLFALNEHTFLQEHGDWRVFPAKKTLAKLTGLTERAIRTAIKALEEKGILTVGLQFDEDGRQRQNMYWLNAPNPLGEGELDSPPRELDAPPRVNEVHGGRVNDVHPIPFIEEPPYKNPKGEKRKRFTPPSLDQVIDYVHEKRLDIDPVRFHDYYESVGWRRGKNQIKDWRACCRTWTGKGSSSGKGTRGRSLAEDLTDRSWAG